MWRLRETHLVAQLDFLERWVRLFAAIREGRAPRREAVGKIRLHVCPGTSHAGPGAGEVARSDYVDHVVAPLKPEALGVEAAHVAFLVAVADQGEGVTHLK